MEEKEKLLKELENEFNKLKSELKLKSNFNELEEAFSIKNFILKERFVSDNLSAQIRGRIVEYFNSAASYLHSLLLPNPQNIVNLNESKLFDSDEKKKIGELIGNCMYFSSRNTLLNLGYENKNKEEEGKFIDGVLKFYQDSFSKEMIKLMKKVSENWGK